MKKIHYIKTIFLATLGAVLFSSSSGGYDDNLTGSPNSGGTCNSCHGGGNNTGGAITLTGIPATFTHGQTYTLTLTFTLPTKPSAVRAGFQIEAVDAVTDAVYGTLAAGADSREAFNTTGVLTHDGAKNFTVSGTNKTVSWTFDWTAPASGNNNNVKFYYVVNAANGNSGTNGDNIYSANKTVAAPTIAMALQLKAKVFLNDMTNTLSTDPSFPFTDPYSVANAFSGNYSHVNNPTIATTTPAIISANPTVDWMFVELRNGASGTTSVVETKAALLQTDGDIVATDGVSPLSFNSAAGNYYVAIRHRNNLGFRTANTVALSGTPTVLDFTNNTTPLYGSTPLVQIPPSMNWVMVSGDANSDGSVDAFDTIIWEQQNGLFNDYNNNADYNLDGSVDAFDSIVWELNNGKFQELD